MIDASRGVLPLADTAFAAPLGVQEFLAWEERQPERSERVGGVVRMMAGGTRANDIIGNNVRGALQSVLRGGHCVRHGPDVKVLSPQNDVMYADALVPCGPADPRATWIDDPVVVVEVLSESTAEHDLTRKRLAYKTIPSLRLIVFVHQRRARVDLLRRDVAGRWDDDVPALGLDGVLEIPEIGARLALRDVYEGIEVEPEEARVVERRG